MWRNPAVIECSCSVELRLFHAPKLPTTTPTTANTASAVKQLDRSIARALHFLLQFYFSRISVSSDWLQARSHMNGKFYVLCSKFSDVVFTLLYVRYRTLRIDTYGFYSTLQIERATFLLTTVWSLHFSFLIFLLSAMHIFRLPHIAFMDLSYLLHL